MSRIGQSAVDEHLNGDCDPHSCRVCAIEDAEVTAPEPMKPKIEKAGSIWWVNWEIVTEGMIVQKARPEPTFEGAITFADREFAG